jgi:hypothetical protein
MATLEGWRSPREMHDVIAHSLTVMVSLADGAAAKLRSKPEQAAVAIGNVSEIGRQALGDTRRLLGVLRADGATFGAGAPTGRGPDRRAAGPGAGNRPGGLAQRPRTGAGGEPAELAAREFAIHLDIGLTGALPTTQRRQ